jgi:hypothetical protein
MNWLSSLKNQTVLLALVGVGVFNGLLCAVMILRESSNATQIVRLESEAKAATLTQDAKAAEMKAGLESAAKTAAQEQQAKSVELKAENAMLRSDLERMSQDLAKAQLQIKKTADELADASKALKSAVADLQAVTGIVAQFQTNNPWLVDPKQRPPWDLQIEKMLKDKKK